MKRLPTEPTAANRRGTVLDPRPVGGSAWCRGLECRLQGPGGRHRARLWRSGETGGNAGRLHDADLAVVGSRPPAHPSVETWCAASSAAGRVPRRIPSRPLPCCSGARRSAASHSRPGRPGTTRSTGSPEAAPHAADAQLELAHPPCRSHCDRIQIVAAGRGDAASRMRWMRTSNRRARRRPKVRDIGIHPARPRWRSPVDASSMLGTPAARPLEPRLLPSERASARPSPVAVVPRVFSRHRDAAREGWRATTGRVAAFQRVHPIDEARSLPGGEGSDHAQSNRHHRPRPARRIGDQVNRSSPFGDSTAIPCRRPAPGLRPSIVSGSADRARPRPAPYRRRRADREDVASQSHNPAHRSCSARRPCRPASPGEGRQQLAATPRAGRDRPPGSARCTARHRQPRASARRRQHQLPT